MSGQQATATATRYYPTPGGALAVRDATGLSYFATDHLGTPIATVNLDTGAVLGEQLRAPYGEARYAVQANNPSGGMHTTIGFTGQREDTANGNSGLDYFNARYYDAAVGRFTSADVVVGADWAFDGYAYVGGMVVSATDPSGHHVEADIGAGNGGTPEGESQADLADGSSNGPTVPPAFYSAFEGDPVDALDPTVTATITEGDTTTTLSVGGEGTIDATTEAVTNSGTSYATSWLRVGQAGFSAAQQQLNDDILGVTPKNKAAYMTHASSSPSGGTGNGGGTGASPGTGTTTGTSSGTTESTPSPEPQPSTAGAGQRSGNNDPCDPRVQLAQCRKDLNAGRRRTVAFANYTINGVSGTVSAVSGTANRVGGVGVPLDRLFTATATGQNTREFDAELKILEYLGAQFSGMTGVTGTIDLYVDNIPCSSCEGVFSQFTAMFPGITLNVIPLQ